jgi:citrate lyase beta subunit
MTGYSKLERTRRARRILAALEAAEAEGRGVIVVDNQMIDALVVARAREVPSIANLHQDKIS